jgi:hypothetical protein
MEYNWSAGSFDAIGIRVHDASISIMGTEADDIRLESSVSEKHAARFGVDKLGGWLWISNGTSVRDIHLTLLLPKQKAWLIDLYARNVNFQADNILARLNLILTKGEVRLNGCRGAFNLASGNSNVIINRFSEEAVPEMPALPDSKRKEKSKSPGKVINMSWGKEDWAQWGLDFSEKMVKGLLGQKGGAGRHQGIDIKIAKGDLQIEDTDAETCVIKSARSDVKIEAGRISNLDLTVIRGDIESDTCIPAGDWKIKTHSGDISLIVTSDIHARIDAATRHGDIKSLTPLVRVARQGPEPWHGVRMVGIIGSVPDKMTKIPEIRLSVLRGDMKIETKPVASQASKETEVHEEAEPSTPPDSYKTPMAVLEALSEGRITVGEAEKILDILESGKKTA